MPRYERQIAPGYMLIGFAIMLVVALDGVRFDLDTVRLGFPVHAFLAKYLVLASFSLIACVGMLYLLFTGKELNRRIESLILSVMILILLWTVFV